MQNMRLETLRYDAATGASEASLDLRRDERAFRFPCRVEAPAPRNRIEAGRIRLALRQSDWGRCRARLH